MKSDLSHVVLNGRKLRGDVAGAITDATLERTIDGCSTITLVLDDHARTIITSPLVAQAAQLSFDGLAFTLSAVQKQSDQVTLTFEETAVARLRLQTKPVAKSRSAMTRAQFAGFLVAELTHPTVPFWCPEETERQKVAGRAGKYQFTRGGQGQIEDSWAALQRLAQEVQWRCFCRAGTIVFARDATLLAQPVALKLTERTSGVNGIDFDYDPGKKAQTATVNCRIDKWSVPPGSPVSVSGCGVGNGTWLVQSINRSLFYPEGSVQLTRAQAQKLEPAGNVPTRVRVGSGGGKNLAAMAGAPSGGLADLGNIMVRWGLQLLGRNNYRYGAGHLGYPAIKNVTPPMDCSAFAAGCAAQIGVDITGTTYTMASAGRTSRAAHGFGGSPPGGWLPGDIIEPFDHHVSVCMGNGHVVEALCTACGIVVSPQTGPYANPYFWWRVTELSPLLAQFAAQDAAKKTTRHK